MDNLLERTNLELELLKVDLKDHYHRLDGLIRELHSSGHEREALSLTMLASLLRIDVDSYLVGD